MVLLSTRLLVPLSSWSTLKKDVIVQVVLTWGGGLSVEDGRASASLINKAISTVDLGAAKRWRESSEIP